LALTQPGDLIQLSTSDRQYFFVRLVPGQALQTHRGVVLHDDLIGKPLGSRVTTHLGKGYVVLSPSLSDILVDLKRTTQIAYPKDIGYLLLKLSIAPGQTVVEAGTGSGAMTLALAHAVGPTGRVVSYESRPDAQALARKNLALYGLADRVEFKVRDIAQGFDETEVPALFLDVARPYDYIPQVRAALAGGGLFACVVPTTNQVSDLIVAMERESFSFIEVCETFLRYYKAVPQRLRPVDRMVGHTVYLVFGRPVEPQDVASEQWTEDSEQGAAADLQ